MKLFLSYFFLKVHNSTLLWCRKVTIYIKSADHGKNFCQHKLRKFEIQKYRKEAPLFFSNRAFEYLRHNFPWDGLISRQTENTWLWYSQDLNPSDYFLREYLKDRVYENNLQTREDINRKEIRQISEEMLNRVVNNFNVWVAAVLPYSSAVHGRNKVLINEKV